MSGLLRAAVLTRAVQPNHWRSFEKVQMSEPQNERFWVMRSEVGVKLLHWKNQEQTPAVEGEEQRRIVSQGNGGEAEGQGNGQLGKGASGEG